ncbi:(2Fe-2S)-binding protein [Anaerotruncus sp. AF02-27]|uniref:(2Fe-2S)-binding protein n=1 Tax=Anaerotruncus TaxID=244127 RepID=UPI000E491AF6|nr:MULTISPECIES: (2Fe-2S)-binding protein [Anaerotruncus]RGX54761.1 (2Fe-2S)-binding protein [Anaerotruncus sp. AF02-27]
MDKITISFTLNGKPYTVATRPDIRMLDVLRDDLNLTGTKEGCGIGECGACTVLVNGEAMHSCMVISGQMDGKDILTVEGLSETEIGKTLQRCFLEEGAVQCGYCTPGMLMSAYALLRKNPNPTRDEVRLALSGNLCRCTGYIPIINAVQKVNEKLNASR